MDLAFWGFILGAIGAILSSILAIQQIADGLRAKSEERESKAKELLQGVFGPIRTADDNFGFVALSRLADNLLPNRDRIIGLHPTLQKIAPNVAKHLNELIELMEQRDTEHLGSPAIALNKNNETRPLVAALRDDIEKWLSDHA